MSSSRFINLEKLHQSMYREKDGAATTVQDLNVVCHQIPVHVIFGGNPDYL